MPLDLKALQTKGATVTIPAYGDEIRVTYDPTVWTTKFRDEYREAMQATRAGEDGERKLPTFSDLNKPTATALAKLIREWDLVDNGEPLPIKADVINQRVPEELQNHILQAIREDIGNLGNPRNSPNGSSPKDG